MVNANITREPHKRLRQHIIGTAVKRRMLTRPFRLTRPMSFIKLMLDVKQPNTDRPTKADNWNLHD